jgi:hypothetical protein
MGSNSNDGDDSDNVNRAEKRNRDGTDTDAISTLGHIGAQVSKEITVSNDGVSGSVNCGGCHDPYGGREP